ncbi:MAG: hypothetical protein RR448_10540, partial [Niameybacter sp.]
MLFAGPVLTIALCSFFIQKNFTLHIKAAEEVAKRSEESENQESEEDDEDDEDAYEDEYEEDEEAEGEALEDGEDKSFLKYI